MIDIVLSCSYNTCNHHLEAPLKRTLTSTQKITGTKSAWQIDPFELQI